MANYSLKLGYFSHLKKFLFFVMMTILEEGLGCHTQFDSDQTKDHLSPI